MGAIIAAVVFAVAIMAIIAFGALVASAQADAELASRRRGDERD